MNKHVIIALFVGLLIGAVGTYSIVSVNQPSNTTHAINHDNSMTGMNESLKGKSGDAFDKEFIIQMIEHHQGAIDMAKQAKTNAGHEELKSMADDIISAQAKEIEMMKQWQKAWGYTH